MESSLSHRLLKKVPLGGVFPFHITWKQSHRVYLIPLSHFIGEKSEA